VVTVANWILSFPLGMHAQKSWAPQCEAALANGDPIAEVLPKKGAVPFLYGVLLGGVVGGSIAFLTRLLVSSHWLYQAILASGFFLGAGQMQERYLTAGTRHRHMFGLTGDRTISLMYGGYGWGALFAIIGLALWSWLG